MLALNSDAMVAAGLVIGIDTPAVPAAVCGPAGTAAAEVTVDTACTSGSPRATFSPVPAAVQPVSAWPAVPVQVTTHPLGEHAARSSNTSGEPGAPICSGPVPSVVTRMSAPPEAGTETGAAARV